MFEFITLPWLLFSMTLILLAVSLYYNIKFAKTITKNKDIYDMSKRLPDELSEDMRQRFLQELTSISDEPLKEISSSLKELKKKRKEESNSNESDGLSFGEDSQSFDSELERRKKFQQVCQKQKMFEQHHC